MGVSTVLYMKKMHRHYIITALLQASLVAASGQVNWNGLGNSLNWGDNANWSPTPPGMGLDTVFVDTLGSGYTNAPGKVNNIVDSPFSIGTLAYQSVGTNNYTTLIPTGQTLSLSGVFSGTPAYTLLAGRGVDPLTAPMTNTATITGGGSLFANNPAGLFMVAQATATAIAHYQSLNLGGLNSFIGSFSNVWVGASPFVDKSIGILTLATNNFITTSPNLSAPGILIGNCMTNSGYGQVVLGAVNTFNTDGLVVGGNRAANFNPNNRLNFVPGTTNNSFTLRGSAGGATPASVFSIADVSANTAGYTAVPSGFSGVTGAADFSGGTVDILAGTMNVGRTGFDSSDPVNNRGTVTGSLLFEKGTIEAGNLNLGFYQSQSAQAVALGTITARSNAVLKVDGNLTMAFLATTNGSSGFGTTSGTLVVNDQALVSVGGNIVDGGGLTILNLAGGTIDMQPPTSAVPGNVDIKSISGFGVITNAGTIRLNGTNIPGTLTTPGALLLGGNLNMDSNCITYFNVGTNISTGTSGGSDYIWVGGTNAVFNNPRLYLQLSGGLIPGATYRIIDCPNATSVSGTVNAESPRFAPVMVTSTGVVMVVNASTNVGSVTWQGQLGNVWDTSLANTNWGLSGNSDAFRQYDNVVFDDTMVNQVIWPSGPLFPSSVVFNGNIKDFAITNRYGTTPAGAINGSTGITKNGLNTVIFGLTNSFTGPVNINNGVLKIVDPTFTTPGGALVLGASNGPIVIANGATLDISGVGAISYGKTNFVSGNGFNGLGAITNSALSGNPTERWYFMLQGDSTFALNTAPMTIQNPLQTATYGGWLNLNGFTLTKTGTNALVFQQCSVTNPGSINLAGGELRLNHTFLGGSGSLNLSNGSILSVASTSATTNYVTKTAINLAAGANAAIVAPNNASAATPTFTVGSPINLGGSLLVSNAMTVQITNGISGSGSLTKGGNSNLVLAAVNAFIGPTAINQGRLTLAATGSLASTNITINGGILDITAAGLTLAGQTLILNSTNSTVVGNLIVPANSSLLSIGTNNGNLTLNSGTLSPSTLATVGTLRVNTNLNLNAANVVMNLGGNTNVGGLDNDLIVCSNLTFSGVSTITIAPVGALVSTPNTPYTLIRYTGVKVGDASNLSIVSPNPRYTFTVLDPASTPGSIQIQISSTGSTVDIWHGLNAANPSAWDFAVSYNWLNGGAASPFFSGDSVVFNDQGLTNGVDLIGTVQPASILFSNNASTYTLRGAGQLVAGTMTLDTTSTGGVVIANAETNTLNGAGITLNPGTTLTFNQPVNTTLNSSLIGSGSLVKTGANTLTVIGNSEANFAGTNLVVAGTMRLGSAGALGGTNATIITGGGTLDLNGQAVSPMVFASGAGTGAGAIDNTGSTVISNRALTSLVLTGPTTLGASSNRWDIGRWIADSSYGSTQPPYIPAGAYFNAQSNTLVKVGPSDLWIDASGETYLADVKVGAGRLVVSNPTWSNNVPPTLGYAQNTITISNGATFAMDGGFPFQMQDFGSGHNWGVDGGTKPIHVLSGGTFEAISGTHTLYGSVTLEPGAFVKSDESSGVMVLYGNLQGPGDLLLSGNGGVKLAGDNTYGSNTVVRGANLIPSVSTALPANSTVVLSNSPSAMTLADGAIMNPDASLQMMSLGGGGQGPILAGAGTWTGPISMTGNQGFVFNGTIGGLNVTGPISTVGASGTITLDFDHIHFATALQFQGSVNITYQSGLSAGALHRPELTLDAQNYWTNMIVARGRLNIRTNNALPPNAPISAGSLIAGFDDRTLIIDLGGFNQTFSSIAAPQFYINDFRIGNSSATSDSIVTYAGAGANTWTARIQDDLDQNGGKTIGLTVASGSLTLSGTSTYTGPTLVSGGILQVASPNGVLGNTAVTVQGGTLGGTGSILGPVTNTAGGTLSPGFLVGTLTISNSLTLLAGGTTWVEINNQLGTADEIIANSILYGGRLVVTNFSSTPFTNGSTYKLFDASSYSGVFSSIEPASPGAGLMWDASNLSVNGTISTVTAVAPGITTPVVAANGKVTLNLTGVVGQAYTIRGTSDLSVPLSNWPVLQSGGLPSASYQWTDSNTAGVPTRFYIISTP